MWIPRRSLVRDLIDRVILTSGSILTVSSRIKIRNHARNSCQVVRWNVNHTWSASRIYKLTPDLLICIMSAGKYWHKRDKHCLHRKLLITGWRNSHETCNLVCVSAWLKKHLVSSFITYRVSMASGRTLCCLALFLPNLLSASFPGMCAKLGHLMYSPCRAVLLFGKIGASHPWSARKTLDWDLYSRWNVNKLGWLLVG